MSQIPSKINQKLLSRFVVSNNTFSRNVKDNPKDRITVEIGDSKQADFKPQVKIMRWLNEVNFSMRAQEHPDAVVETEGKLIKYKTPEYEVHQYELDPSDIGEDGGLEFEWVLPSKPSTNVLTATIQTKELDFFYQPPLTQEEIDQGAKRPENVVGSYAVYHKTKGGINRADGMEYKAGKAFHIYRPKVKDADGSEVWGELNIDEQKGELTVTIDQTWLDKAVYPVVVDPTFGYTSIGGSYNYWSEYADLTNGFTLSEDGDVESISVYMHDENGNGPKNVIMGLYDNTRNLLATTGEATVPLNETGDWFTGTIASPYSATVGTYGLAFRQDGEIYKKYDTGTGRTNLDFLGAYAASMPDPLNNDSTQNEISSIYATYTASAVPVVGRNAVSGRSSVGGRTTVGSRGDISSKTSIT